MREEALEKLYSLYTAQYAEKTKKSRELHERAKKLMPAGVTYAIRHFYPHPIYIARAKGTRVWDVDGNEYIDLWMGHGAHLLGHLPEVVVEAVREVLEFGTHVGFEHSYAVEYAELLSKIIPGSLQYRFTNSGTEANMYAVRLARAYTKRKYIVKMEGGWHGSVDALHIRVRRLNDKPESAGILDEQVKYTIIVPFNDLSALEEVLRKHEVAAVILEPVMGAAGCIEPDREYLREVRRLTHERSVLLVFDEVITGFRLAPGGAQEYFGVKADIVVLGKALGGGVGSIGAVGSSEEIMSLMDHTKTPPGDLVFHGGTFVANPVVIRAGHALVKYLSEHSSLYERSNNLWSWFRRKIEQICSEYGINCWSTGEGSLTGIHFTARRPRNAREVEELRWSGLVEKTFHMYSRVKGVLYVSETRVHYLPSLIHSKEEVEYVVDVFTSFLDELKKATSQ